MKKGIIIYMSKYGSTKQYADWLSEDTGFKAIAADNPAALVDLKNAEIVIFGGWFRAGKPIIASWIKKYWSDMQGKKVILYSTGGSMPEEQERQRGFVMAFPDKRMRNLIHYFPVGGRVDIPRAKFFDRLVLKIVVMIKFKDPEERKRRIESVQNHVNRKYLEPILKTIKELLEEAI